MKKFFTILFTLILMVLVELLVISYSVKEICINTISDSMVKEAVSSRVLDEVVEEFPKLDYDDLRKIELETQNNDAINTLTKKYFDSMVDSIANNTEIKVPSNKEELNKIINDNIDLLNELDVDITEEQKDKIIDTLTSNDNRIEEVYETVSESIKNGMTEEQRKVINVYSTFTSNAFRYILIGLIILFILLIAFIKNSLYKWMINLSIVGIINGLITSFVIPFISNELSLKITNKLLGRSTIINVNNLINIGYILLGVGAVLMLFYIILNIIIKSTKKSI